MTAMSIASLIGGFALPWALGIAALALLPNGRKDAAGQGEWPWLAGCGWFVGLFLLTLWMRGLAAMAVPFGIVAIGGPATVLTVAFGGLLAWRSRGPGWKHSIRAVARAAAGVDLQAWQRVVWLGLLTWLSLRFVLLLGDVVWRPLYPWDAWTQWATKARVWFELGTMAPFVTASEWLNATAPNVWFDAAPHYPATVPLFQVWAATLLGRWDDSLVNLPWWLTGIAFGFAIYGALRRQSFDPLPSLLGTWLVLSLPILDTHIALAGYADLPLSTYFTLGVVAALAWPVTRSRRDAAIALLLLAACIVIKNPGIVWVATVLPGLIVALFPRHGLRIAAFAFAAAAIIILVLARSEVHLLGYGLHLDFQLPLGALFDSYFTLANWHLLWYGLVGCAILAWRRLFSRELAPLTVVITAGITFLLFGFAFTNAGAWVEDQTTVNRATLHVAPLLVLWMLAAFRAWSAGATDTRRDSDSGASFVSVPEPTSAPAPAPVQARQ